MGMHAWRNEKQILSSRVRPGSQKRDRLHSQVLLRVSWDLKFSVIKVSSRHPPSIKKTIWENATHKEPRWSHWDAIRKTIGFHNIHLASKLFYWELQTTVQKQTYLSCHSDQVQHQQLQPLEDQLPRGSTRTKCLPIVGILHRLVDRVLSRQVELLRGDWHLTWISWAGSGHLRHLMLHHLLVLNDGAQGLHQPGWDRLSLLGHHGLHLLLGDQFAVLGPLDRLLHVCSQLLHLCDLLRVLGGGHPRGLLGLGLGVGCRERHKLQFGLATQASGPTSILIGPSGYALLRVWTWCVRLTNRTCMGHLDAEGALSDLQQFWYHCPPARLERFSVLLAPQATVRTTWRQHDVTHGLELMKQRNTRAKIWAWDSCWEDGHCFVRLFCCHARNRKLSQWHQFFAQHSNWKWVS